MKRENLEAMLWGAFYGDAYALGAHWVYDTDEIAQSGLDFSTCNAPITKYHTGKKAGDFTHYGDQMLWLLESIALEGQFSVVDFGSRWFEYMQSYSGYIDGASKHTFDALSKSKNYLACGSSSSDLSIVSRMFPVIFAHHSEPDVLPEAIKLHLIFTHMHKESLQSANYITEVTLALLNGASMQEALSQSIEYQSDFVQRSLLLAQKSLHLKPNKAVKELGQSCSIKGALSATLHFLLAYDNVKEALRANVLAGGDSAARGMIIGALFGAKEGFSAIDEGMRNALSHQSHIAHLIKSI